MKNPVQPVDTDRNHGNRQPGRDHPDTPLEFRDLAPLRPPALREDEHGIAAFHHLADITQGLPRARLPLGKRERRKEQ